MLSQSMLCFLNYRLKEGFPENSNLPFGGVAVLLVGDPAQLPPVLANPLWTKKTANNYTTEG